MLYRKPILGTIGYMGGVPAVLEPFCWAWGQLIQYNTEYVCTAGAIIHYVKATVSLHDFARNSLVQQVEGDWLLLLDTDHSFEPDLAARILRLATTHNLDVVTALYRHKAPPGPPVIYQWSQDRPALAMPIGDWDQSVTALQIGSAGAGCLWIRRAVLDRIREALHEEPFSRYAAYGEDHAFFDRCRRLDIPVYALPQVEAPHLQITPLRMADYRVPDGYTLQRQDTGGLI